MKIVLKISGSLLMSDKKPDIKYLKRLVPVLKTLKNNHQLVLITGGGDFVRDYIKHGRAFLKRHDAEKPAIHLLQANAVLLSQILGMKPLFSMSEVKEKTSGVMGGIAPGRSTDTNAAVCAKRIGADLLIKMSAMNGIYDRDPNKHKNSKLLRHVKFDNLAKFLKISRYNYGILDPMSIRTIARNRIRTVVFNGKNPSNLIKVINGKHIGTLISG